MVDVKRKKRTIQAETSKNRIYEAALLLIAEKGFDETGILDICKMVGCSVGAFYHHFGSKDGILAENFRRADERFAAFAKNELPQTNGRDRVIAYLVRYASFVASDTGIDLARRLYSSANKLFIKKGRSMQTELTRILEEAVRVGDLRLELGAEEACDWLFIGARGIVFHWCLRDGGFDLPQAMRTYAARALRSIELPPQK